MVGRRFEENGKNLVSLLLGVERVLAEGRTRAHGRLGMVSLLSPV